LAIIKFGIIVTAVYVRRLNRTGKGIRKKGLGEEKEREREGLTNAER